MTLCHFPSSGPASSSWILSILLAYALVSVSSGFIVLGGTLGVLHIVQVGGTGTVLRPLTGFAVVMHVWLGSLATYSNCFFLRKFWPADVFDFVSFAIVFVV